MKSLSEIRAALEVLKERGHNAVRVTYLSAFEASRLQALAVERAVDMIKTDDEEPASTAPPLKSNPRRLIESSASKSSSNEVNASKSTPTSSTTSFNGAKNPGQDCGTSFDGAASFDISAPIAGNMQAIRGLGILKSRVADARKSVNERGLGKVLSSISTSADDPNSSSINSKKTFGRNLSVEDIRKSLVMCYI